MSKKVAKHQMDMLNGSILDKLLLFALPLAASSMLQLLFNSADVAVVGRFAGSKALAAVGSNGSVISLLINLFVGLSVGANVVIASLIGRKEEEKISDAVHTTISVALISGIILIFLGYFVAKPILTFMETPEDVLDLAILYLRLYFMGMPFTMVYNFGSAILRSKGDTKRPLYCLCASGMINVLLNLLFVIVFDMSVAGVALATVISNGVSASVIIYILAHEEGPFKLHFKKLIPRKEFTIKMIKIGAPAGIQGMVFSLSNVCIQTAINSFGSNAVAGSAAAINFEYFAYFVINAFSQTVVTFTSQNYGAGKFDRCKKVMHLSLVAGIVSSALLCVIFVAFRSVFIRIYTVDDEVIKFALIRMVYVLSFEFLPTIYEISGAGLRGMGYSMTPAVITILGSCVLRFVWVYTVFAKWRSFVVLVCAYPMTWIVTGLAMILAYYIIRNRAFKTVKL